jgi:1-acyl-sn-glycerol-3-phosphate acyltransferase
MARTVLWFIYFWLLQLVSIPFLLVYFLLGFLGQKKSQENLLSRVTCIWARQMIAAAGGKVEVSGLENMPPPQGVLYVSNHQGAFDIPLLLGYVPGLKGFVSKKQNFRLPVVGTWMKLLRCVILDRENLRQSARAIITGVRYLKEGWSLVIFPEGTRSKSGTMGRFKEGSFKLATRSGVAVVPLTLDGSYRLFEAKGSRITPGILRLHIHPAIVLSALTDEQKNNLAEQVQGIIASRLPGEPS